MRNAAATVGEQLAALATQDFDGAWELIVVDNASTDMSRQVVDAWSARLPNLRVITEPNGGYSRACNTAVRAAHAPLILFCEADDVVSESWARTMVEALGSADLVGGSLEFERLNSTAVRASRNPIQSKRLPVLFGRPYSFGANLGLSRAAFDKVGGFDERFSGGSVDSDLCMRVQLQSGTPIRFVPDAVVHYRLRGSLSGLLKQQYRYAREDERLYAKLWHLGALTSRPAGRYAVAISQLFRAYLEVPTLTDPSRRWRVLSRFAWVAGRFAGFYRARLPPSLTRRPRARVTPASEGDGRSRSPDGSLRPG